MNQPEISTELEAAIPQKLYFRIGEVSRLVGVKPYVLRYWETEFPGLAPNKSGAGHRFYHSANAVWLTDSVPPEFIQFPES